MEQNADQLEALVQNIDHMEQRFQQILKNIGWNEADLMKNHHCKKPKLENEIEHDSKETIASKTKVNSRRIQVKNISQSRLFFISLFKCTQETLTQLPEVSSFSSLDTTPENCMSFAEMTKLKRDLKRRRMKYRTTKSPPLSYTEEIRALIGLQMESWEQKLQKTNKRK